jgi:hypothetical protein
MDEVPAVGVPVPPLGNTEPPVVLLPPLELDVPPT